MRQHSICPQAPVCDARSMGLADDARKKRHAAQAQKSRATGVARDRQSALWNRLDHAVREFIPAARELGIAPDGLLRKRWTIRVDLVPSAGGPDPDSPTAKLVIAASGAWELTTYFPAGSSTYPEASSKIPGSYSLGSTTEFDWNDVLSSWLAVQPRP